MNYYMVLELKYALSNLFNLIKSGIYFLLKSILLVFLYSLEKISNTVASVVLYVLGIFFIPGIYFTYKIINEFVSGMPLESDYIYLSLLFFVAPLMAALIKQIIKSLKIKQF